MGRRLLLLGLTIPLPQFRPARNRPRRAVIPRPGRLMMQCYHHERAIGLAALPAADRAGNRLCCLSAMMIAEGNRLCVAHWRRSAIAHPATRRNPLAAWGGGAGCTEAAGMMPTGQGGGFRQVAVVGVAGAAVGCATGRRRWAHHTAPIGRPPRCTAWRRGTAVAIHRDHWLHRELHLMHKHFYCTQGLMLISHAVPTRRGSRCSLSLGYRPHLPLSATVPAVAPRKCRGAGAGPGRRRGR